MRLQRGFTLLTFVFGGLALAAQASAMQSRAALRLRFIPQGGLKLRVCELLLSTEPPFIPRLTGASRIVRGAENLRGEALWIDSLHAEHYLKRVRTPHATEFFGFADAADALAAEDPTSPDIILLRAVHAQIHGIAPGKLIRLDAPLISEWPGTQPTEATKFTQILQYTDAAVGRIPSMSALLNLPVALTMGLREAWKTRLARAERSKLPAPLSLPLIIYLPDATPGRGILSFYPMSATQFPDALYYAWVEISE